MGSVMAAAAAMSEPHLRADHLRKILAEQSQAWALRAFEQLDLTEEELEARGLKKIQIEGEEDEFLMDNEGNIYDLAGNVREWCRDVYSETFYASAHAAGPDPISRAGSGHRVIRELQRRDRPVTHAGDRPRREIVRGDRTIVVDRNAVDFNAT